MTGTRLTSTAGVALIEAALHLDRAEEEWDNPDHSFHNVACVNLEAAKEGFRDAVAEYRRIHGEPLTTGG